jgi:hypothetical protein
MGLPPGGRLRRIPGESRKAMIAKNKNMAMVILIFTNILFSSEIDKE